MSVSQVIAACRRPLNRGSHLSGDTCHMMPGSLTLRAGCEGRAGPHGGASPGWGWPGEAPEQPLRGSGRNGPHPNEGRPAPTVRAGPDGPKGFRPSEHRPPHGVDGWGDGSVVVRWLGGSVGRWFGGTTERRNDDTATAERGGRGSAARGRRSGSGRRLNAAPGRHRDARPGGPPDWEGPPTGRAVYPGKRGTSRYLSCAAAGSPSPAPPRAGHGTGRCGDVTTACASMCRGTPPSEAGPPADAPAGSPDGPRPARRSVRRSASGVRWATRIRRRPDARHGPSGPGERRAWIRRPRNPRARSLTRPSPPRPPPPDLSAPAPPRRPRAHARPTPTPTPRPTTDGEPERAEPRGCRTRKAAGGPTGRMEVSAGGAGRTRRADPTPPATGPATRRKAARGPTPTRPWTPAPTPTLIPAATPTPASGPTSRPGPRSRRRDRPVSDRPPPHAPPRPRTTRARSARRPAARAAAHAVRPQAPRPLAARPQAIRPLAARPHVARPRCAGRAGR